MVLKITGDKDQVDIAIKELKSLYIDPKNHTLSCKLATAPKYNETPQIIAFIKANFQCEAEIKYVKV